MLARDAGSGNLRKSEAYENSKATNERENSIVAKIGSLRCWIWSQVVFPSCDERMYEVLHWVLYA